MTAHPRHSNQSAERMGANAPGPIRRVMSITRALEWAFRVEQARVEFDDLGDAAGSIRQGIDGIWLMMQRGVLGCKIDGGGHSEPAWDAQVIASAVASLPEGFGGRSMAATIAGLARAGLAPNWMKGARPRIRPTGWMRTRTGFTADTENSKHLGSAGWPPQARRNRKGVIVTEEVRYCPVRAEPTAAQISAARDQYLNWHTALWWIGAELRGLNILETIELTDAMPPMTPWRTDTGGNDA